MKDIYEFLRALIVQIARRGFRTGQEIGLTLWASRSLGMDSLTAMGTLTISARSESEGKAERTK